MSLSEYEEFVYAACHVRQDEDPVAHWSVVSAELNTRARELETFRELRIVGPDTDLRLNVEGRGWVAADGKLNMPDGEIFTSPVETETEGEIRFSFPAIFHGRATRFPPYARYPVNPSSGPAPAAAMWTAPTAPFGSMVT